MRKRGQRIVIAILAVIIIVMMILSLIATAGVI